MDVYAIDASGAGQPTNLTNNAALNSWMATYSPDGRRIVFSAAGHEARPSWLTQAAGLAGILLAAALLMGVVLPLARRFSLPFGALTLIVGLNALMLSVLDDRYVLALAPVSAARPQCLSRSGLCAAPARRGRSRLGPAA